MTMRRCPRKTAKLVAELARRCTRTIIAHGLAVRFRPWLTCPKCGSGAAHPLTDGGVRITVRWRTSILRALQPDGATLDVVGRVADRSRLPVVVSGHRMPRDLQLVVLERRKHARTAFRLGI